MGPFANTTYGSQTRQIGSWYQDEAWFVWSGNPWFQRGGSLDVGEGTGVFTFGSTYGNVNAGNGFRIVLAF